MIRLILVELLGFFKAFRSCLFAPCCRFTPSCTEYAQQALERHSLPRAMRMILGRLLRCHPLHPGGYDPVRSS